jgi:hypothetical protein
MNRSIDFAKSIRRKRLIYHGTRKQRFFLSVKHFMSGTLALLVCLALIAFVYHGGADPAIVALVSVPALLVIISLFLQNRLASAQSTHAEEDQTAIIRFLLHKYPGIIRHNCGEQIIIITSPRTSTFNKEYLILQDGEHIYMNISLYGRGNLKFVFLSIPQYLTSRAVLKNFRQTILRSARSTQQRAGVVI